MRDSSLYPRTYHKKRGQQIMLVLIILSIVMGIKSIFGTHGLWIAGPAALILIPNILNDMFARVTLYEDRVVRKTWFSSKQLMRTDIVGWSKIPRSSQRMLMPKSESQYDGVLIPSDINEDDVWKTWMSSIPNLETTKEQKLVADVKDHPELGKSQEERAQNLKHDVSFSKWLSRITYCGIVTGFIPPIFHHFTTYLFIIIPWIALYNLYKRAATYAKLVTYTNPISGNTSAIFLSGIFLGVFNFIWQDYQIPNSEIGHLLALSLIIALPLLYLTYRCVRRVHWAIMCLICFFGMISYESYGVGVILKIDTALDNSAPTPYTVTITDKPPVQGSGPAIRVSPWFHESGFWQISVSHELYDSVWVNGKACIQLHAGFLGVPWYTIAASKCN